MLELPEAYTAARQLNETVMGKKIVNVIAAASPHKFTFFYGDPVNYPGLLKSKTLERAESLGGMVRVKAGSATLLVGDGVGLRFHRENDQRPLKHQLLLELEDGTAVSASVAMYGGIWCFPEEEFDNPYYQVAQQKPSPLSEQFDSTYFQEMVSGPGIQKLSAKAFLATEQRIPGLGNGVLQDILWHAAIHPKRKISTLSGEDQARLYRILKAVLADMTQKGGRDTEKDLFGDNGGYKTMMSKNSAGFPCIACGGNVKKENYMGGSIYFCENCQKI